MIYERYSAHSYTKDDCVSGGVCGVCHSLLAGLLTQRYSRQREKRRLKVASAWTQPGQKLKKKSRYVTHFFFFF